MFKVLFNVANFIRSAHAPFFSFTRLKKILGRRLTYVGCYILKYPNPGLEQLLPLPSFPPTKWLLHFACHLLEKPSFNFRAFYIKSFVSFYLEGKRNTSTLVISSALLTLSLREPNDVL